MTINQILNSNEHRPWVMPHKKWRYYQEWNNAIFLHWQVVLSELRKFIPNELEIDLYEGKPWVSIVAFRMQNIRPRNLPSFSPISDFEEINIRTYVKYKDKKGVYFLSIEGGKKISCMIAKSISELPYRYSSIQRSPTIFRSNNIQFDDSLSFNFLIKNEVSDKLDLDNWLTERYALFQDSKISLNTFDIHHMPWSMSNIEIENLKVNYPRFQNLLSNSPDKIQYSNGVQVVAWGVDKNRN